MTERNENWRNPDDATSARPDANPDPITGAPGSHPAGTGVGAVAGGLAGAMAGAAIGSAVPVAGTVIGAVVGAVAGGLVGKGVAESVNPTDEDAYWRDTYKTRPYYETGRTYEDYRPAYEHGWESRGRYAGRKFEDVEPELRREWEASGRKDYSWDKARDAARDAWDRIDRLDVSGDPGNRAPAGSPASSTGTPVRTFGTDASNPGLSADAANTVASVNTAGTVETVDRDRSDDRAGRDWGAHPVGTAVGGVAGGTAGVVAGSALGSAVLPGPGTVVGGLVGAVAGSVGGGAVGHEAAEAINPVSPADEESYWRTSHPTRPYYSADYAFDDDYLPAYRYGWESSGRYPGRRFDDVESDLGSKWESFKGKSRLTWEKAKAATRDAWHRVERKLPGDADRDGR